MGNHLAAAHALVLGGRRAVRTSITAGRLAIPCAPFIAVSYFCFGFRAGAGVRAP